MTNRTVFESDRPRPARLAASLAICTFLLLSESAAASDPDNHKGQRGHGNPHGAYAHGGGRGNYNGGYSGGYYRAPPVVYSSPYYQPYASPYYYPPPVVYGPGVGISIGIR